MRSERERERKVIPETNEAGCLLQPAPVPESPPPPESDLPKKVQQRGEKLARKKARQEEQARWLWLALEPWGIDPDVEVRKLYKCATWIELSHWLKTGRVTVGAANFCQQRGLCSACDAQRALVLLRRYCPVIEDARKDNLGVYLMTLTVPPGGEERASAGVPRVRGPAEFMRQVRYCRASMKLLWESVVKLWERKRRRGHGPFRHVDGMICSMEIEHSGEWWHPHLHCVVACDRGYRVDANELRSDWHELTGGKQVNLAPLRGIGDCVEAFKYTVAGNELRDDDIDLEQLAWRFMAHEAIKGRRLLRSFGRFFDISEADEMKEPADGGVFDTYVLRWLCAATGYHAFRLYED